MKERKLLCRSEYLTVVYFDAAHSKCWSKSQFLMFLMPKLKKKKKQEICYKILMAGRRIEFGYKTFKSLILQMDTQILAKNVFFKFAPKRWSSVLFPEKNLFLLKTSFHI